MQQKNQTGQQEAFNRKKFPERYRKPILKALSFYPELKDISIEFRPAKAPITAYTTVKPSTIHRSARRRTYIVHITEEITKGREDALLTHADEDCQVGIIGHELAHITDYLQKPGISVVATGLIYFLKPYKQKLESEMDYTAILHGVGPYLLAWNRKIMSLRSKHHDDKYFKSYFDYYMTPEEIESIMMAMEADKDQPVNKAARKAG